MGLFGGGLFGTIGKVLGGPIGGIAGTVLGGLGGRGRSGADAGQAAASGYLNQIPEVTKEYMTPFYNQYVPAQRETQDIYGKMLGQYQNPSESVNFLNKLMQSYEPSTGYQYKQNKMGSAARNSAAAGGFLGTKFDQEQQAQLMKDLLGEDMQQYLSNLQGITSGRERIYGMQAGTAQDKAQRAWEAANSIGGTHANVLGNQAQLGYSSAMENAAQRNANRQNMFRGIGGLLGSNGIFGNNQSGGWF